MIHQLVSPLSLYHTKYRLYFQIQKILHEIRQSKPKKQLYTRFEDQYVLEQHTGKLRSEESRDNARFLNFERFENLLCE